MGTNDSTPNESNQTREIPIRERLSEYPTTPGVYLMKDKAGEIVYVGKAANLRSRLRSYFARSGGDERFFVHLLDHVLGDIEVVLTRTAKEALLVENELIKTHQPRFNIKLKDDKNFLNLRIGNEHPYPRLEVVRKRRKDGAKYFGPYASASMARQTLRQTNRYFKLRTCRDNDFKNRSRPCLEYQIKRCDAPCVLDVSPESYAENVRQVSLFLDGRGDQLVDHLRERMADAATNMDFEQAATLRDQAKAVEASLQRQAVVMNRMTDLDVFGVGREGPYAAVHVQEVRGGRIKRAQAFKLGKNEAPNDVLLGQFVEQYYLDRTSVPKEVLLSTHTEDMTTLADWLSDRLGSRVQLKVPQRGERRRMVELAEANASSSLKLDQGRQKRQREVLGELQRRLRLTKFPERIECFDISNVQGTDPVASMVVFIDGEPDKSEYRRFHIRTQSTPDDFLMMKETLTRRFKRSLEGNWDIPDLVVIDGGKGQLRMVREVFLDLNVRDVDLVSLAKSRLLEGQSGDDMDRSPERVFVPGVKDPIVLRQNSAPLYLLARLRDEAHRFAITFHRNTRRKRRLTSSLDDIPGIGPGRRNALLRHFGSLKKVKLASADELSQVRGISQAVAQTIFDTFESDRTENNTQ